MFALKFFNKIEPLIIACLIGAFVYLFGLNFYNKYAKKDIFIKEYTQNDPSESLEAPAVTICVNPVF